nr:hypothetical protein [Xylanimonas oleitrophica]
MVLDHGLEEEAVELGALGGLERRQLLVGEHARHVAVVVLVLLAGPAAVPGRDLLRGRHGQVALAEPVAHVAHLAVLHHADPLRERAHLVRRRPVGHQVRHDDCLPVVADHLGHERDVGLRPAVVALDAPVGLGGDGLGGLARALGDDGGGGRRGDRFGLAAPRTPPGAEPASGRAQGPSPVVVDGPAKRVKLKSLNPQMQESYPGRGAH